MLIEGEYAMAHLPAGVCWIEALIDGLRSRKLEGDSEELRAMARQFDPAT